MQSYREVECNLCENWLKEVNFESHLFDHHESEDCSDAMGEAREVLAGFHLDVGVGADVDEVNGILKASFKSFAFDDFKTCCQG